MSRISSELVDRYLAGEATREEIVIVDAWLARHPEHTELLVALREVPQEEALPVDASGEEATWMRIRRRTGANASSVAPATVRRASRTVIATILTSAALLGAILMAVMYGRNAEFPRTAKPAQVYTTTTGERTTVRLLDGSTVILAPRSRLTVAGDFGSDVRTVSLVGEAYFNVTHTSGAPFTVHTGSVTTRVLGTAFDIRRYENDGMVQVAVVSGKVVSRGRGAPMTMVAGTVAHVTDSTATVISTAEASRFVDWTQGRLVFERTLAPVMLATIGRWYGYEFHLADSTLGAEPVSAVFNVDRPDETMKAIKELLDVTMTFDGRVVTLRSRRVIRPVAPRRDRAAFSPIPEAGR